MFVFVLIYFILNKYLWTRKNQISKSRKICNSRSFLFNFENSNEGMCEWFRRPDPKKRSVVENQKQQKLICENKM